MDRGAWRATVHGVTESQTRLSHTHTHTHYNTDATMSSEVKCVPLELTI